MYTSIHIHIYVYTYICAYIHSWRNNIWNTKATISTWAAKQTFRNLAFHTGWVTNRFNFRFSTTFVGAAKVKLLCGTACVIFLDVHFATSFMFIRIMFFMRGGSLNNAKAELRHIIPYLVLFLIFKRKRNFSSCESVLEETSNGCAYYIIQYMQVHMYICILLI